MFSSSFSSAHSGNVSRLSRGHLIVLIAAALLIGELHAHIQQAANARVTKLKSRFSLKSKRMMMHEPVNASPNTDASAGVVADDVMNRCIYACEKCSTDFLSNKEATDDDNMRVVACANQCLDMSEPKEVILSLLSNMDHLFKREFAKCFIMYSYGLADSDD